MAADLNGLNADLRSRVQALIAASGGKVTAVSGYRSPEHQARLVEAAKAKYGAGWRKWVAPPGKSNHNHGEAVDLGGDLNVAHQLAPQFNLSFPMPWEKWHVQRADFKSAPGAYTQPPDTAQPSAAPTTSIAPAPTDRMDASVTRMLSFLDNPIDFSTDPQVA